MRKVDVAILGAGTAGLTALGVVRKRTEDYVIINDGPYGTTCSRVGCMPSKALIQIANDFHRRRVFDERGIRGGESLTMDIPAALAWVRNYRDGLVARVLKATESIGERNIPGRAELVAPDRIRVERPDGTAEQIQARATIIATGTHPVVPKPWTHIGHRVLTTDNVFEQQDMPRRIAVVGLGAVGLELGQAFSRLGLEVTGFELRDEVAAFSDPVLQEYARERFSAEFPLYLGRPVELREAGGSLLVDNGETRVETDAVVAALGRHPNLDGMGLERLGVDLDGHGMPPCDPHTLQIADLPVFMAGDVNGARPVMHEASDEGFIAAWNALEGTRRVQRRVPLTIAFTEPQIAMVGSPFSEFREGAVRTAGYDFANQHRAVAMRAAEGRLRVYAELESGRLLGAEMMAPAAEHMAHMLALALSQQMTVTDVLRTPIYHPVLEEGLRSALRSLAKAVHDGPPFEFRELGGGDV